MKPVVSIMWFRRDLRLHDNAALSHALQTAGQASGAPVLPIFIFDKQILDSLNRYNLSTFLEIEGFLPHDIAIDRMLSSSLLLLIIPNSERNNLIITGKIFEYLATSKPILSIGPNGNASDIISESGNNKSTKTHYHIIV